MSARFFLSERAALDLRDLKVESLRKWGDAQTYTYLDALEKRLQWLADSPYLGRSRDEVREGLRSYSEGSHVVFYRARADGIEVVGILHQRQDLQRYFGH